MKPLFLSAGAIATLWGGFIDGLTEAAFPTNQHEIGKALAAFVLLLVPALFQLCWKKLLDLVRRHFGAPKMEALEALRGMIQEEVAHAQACHVPLQLSTDVQPSISSLDGTGPTS